MEFLFCSLLIIYTIYSICQDKYFLYLFYYTSRTYVNIGFCNYNFV
nr:MAG TPA: hypothetical protein [Caudoviricetes sp.]DAG69177.1 MAG TPA: hypothetical protein [Caudoviricetes sp.]